MTDIVAGEVGVGLQALAYQVQMLDAAGDPSGTVAASSRRDNAHAADGDIISARYLIYLRSASDTA